MEILMNMFSYPADVQTGLRDILVEQASAGFSDFEDHALEAHLIACETADFHWEARIQERYLGDYEGGDDDEIQLDRVAILGLLQGKWFTATALVDGDGSVHDLVGLQLFDDVRTADRAFGNVR